MTSIDHTSTLPRAKSVFALGDDAAYLRWRDVKLANYPRRISEIAVELSSLVAPSPSETRAVIDACARANMCRYRSREPCGDAVAVRRALGAFARHFGLSRFEDHRSAAADGIVAIEMTEDAGERFYIPYTNRPLGWHTDGYYNYGGPGRMIRSMLLHCLRGAGSGGENGMLDHEIAYIRLRDENPDFIAALMHKEAMTVPADEAADGKTREENTGPVFALDPDTGALAMRYTARKRHIRWRQDAATQAAVRALEAVLRDDPLILRAKLGPGEGIICNNVLHDRTGFEDDPESGRLLLRIRSFDPIRPA